MYYGSITKICSLDFMQNDKSRAEKQSQQEEMANHDVDSNVLGMKVIFFFQIQNKDLRILT